MFLTYEEGLSDSIVTLQRRGTVSRIFQIFDQKPIFLNCIS